MKYILRKCTVLLMAAALAVWSAGCVFAADVSADPCLQSGAPEESVSVKWTDYQDHWARDYIDIVTERGYMTSTGGYFAPDEPMTRAMFVQALAAMAGVTGSEGMVWGVQADEPYEPDLNMLSETFSDIDVNAPYAEAAAWAVDKGIVNGMGDGTFGPSVIIDRQTMAVMMHRTTDALGIELNEDWSVMMDYNDLDQVSDWAIEGIAYCTMTGLMRGDHDGDFAPNRMLTRAEGAAVLVRLAEHVNR